MALELELGHKSDIARLHIDHFAAPTELTPSTTTTARPLWQILATDSARVQHP